MNELYPIIRRKRRPLIETNPEMPKAEPVAIKVAEQVSADESQQVSEANVTSKRTAR